VTTTRRSGLIHGVTQGRHGVERKGRAAMQTAKARTRRARDPFDVSHLVGEAAERQVLAGVLVNLDRDIAAARAITAEIAPEMFYGEHTSPLFTITHRVIADVTEPSRADVLAALHRAGHGQGDDVFGTFVDAVADYAGMESQALRLARQAAAEVREIHARRQAIHAAEMVARGGGNPDALAGLLRQLERVQSASINAGSSRPLTLIDCVDAWAQHESTPVVPTGLGWFDGPTEGGLPIGGITALVACPNVGKSALSLQMTLAALVHDQELRAVWGLGEMTPQALARRAACVASTMLDGCEAVTMQGAGDRTKAARAANVALCNVIGDRLAIIPAPLTVDRIEERVIATGARLVVIDYLQLIRGGDAKDRVQELEHIIGRIRDLAITRECAAVCISSTSRATDSSSRIGQLAKGATEIDYAVDLLYLGEADEHSGNVTWFCKKARNLERRDLLLQFDGASQTYGPQGFDEFSSFAPRQ
jgi:replicative DNA helicase